MIIVKGTLITCPTCKKDVARLTRDIRTGDQIVASQFEGIQAEILPGQMALSPCCRQLWFDGRRLHTQDGWQPRDRCSHG